MWQFGWREWLRQRRRAAARDTRRRAPGQRPRVEALESRLIPATHIWTGGSSVSLNWSDPANWNGGAPAIGEANVVLDFGPVANNRKATVDDIAGSPQPASLVIDQINITDTGYSFSATGTSSITLNGGAASPTVGDTVGGNTFAASLPVALGGSSNSVFQLLAGTDTVNSTVTGGQGITLSGAGTLVLTGPNTYSGGTHVTGGAVNAQNNTALGTGPALVDTGAALDLQAPMMMGMFGQPLPGSLQLANNITLNGPGVGGSGALRSVAGFNTLSGNVTLQSDSTVGVDPASFLSIGPLGGGSSTATMGGAISGPGGLTKVEQGVLLLSGSSANTYGGPTAVNAGTLILQKSPGVVAVPHDLTIGTGAGSMGSSSFTTSPTVSVAADGQIANSSRVTINSDGILNINFASDTIGSLTGNGLLQFGSGSSTSGMGSSTSGMSGPAPSFNVGADNTSTTFAGTIAGSAGNFVKIGGGVLVLSGNSPFGGTTSVSGGKLLVDGSLAGSATVANAGGTLGGSGTVGPLTANAGGVVAPGDSPGVLSVHGGATFNPGSVFLVAVNGAAAGSGYSQLNVSGPVTLNGPFLQLALGFIPPRGVDFVLIANNGSGPVGGGFAGLPEDALLRHGSTFFDLSYAGGRGRDVDLLSQSRDDVFVRALFADFNAQSNRTTRAPFEGRAGSGESRFSVSRAFLESPVRRMGLVNQFYALFGMPDDGMKGVYLAQLMRGVPPGQVLINFINSRSFRRLHHNSRTFLLQLFSGLLGHAAGSHDQIGGHSLNFYVQQLNSGAVSRGQLVKQLLSSDEVYAAAVMQNHETFLGKPPSAAQLQATVGQMLVGALTPDSLSESIVATEVYLDFFLTRAGGSRVPGVVLVNV